MVSTESLVGAVVKGAEVDNLPFPLGRFLVTLTVAFLLLLLLFILGSERRIYYEFTIRLYKKTG